MVTEGVGPNEYLLKEIDSELLAVENMVDQFLEGREAVLTIAGLSRAQGLVARVRRDMIENRRYPMEELPF